MKNLAIYIFLFLFNFWGYNQTRYRSTTIPVTELSKTWEIVKVSNNRIISFLNGSDTIEKIPKTANGYPIKYFESDNIEHWDDNKNRYLFRFGEQYCIADSNLNIVIGLSDSIIPTILYDSLGPIVIDYMKELHYSCLYQVINNHKTLLLNNNGDTITPFPYEGLIVFSYSKLNDALHQQVFISTIFTEETGRKFGVVENSGKILLPNEFDYIQTPEYWSRNPYFILTKYKDNSYRTADYFVFSHKTKSIVFEAEKMDLELYEHEVYVFEKDGLFGIYHPTFGVIEKPKYVKIYQKKNGVNHMYNDLMLVTKKGKEIKWVISEEIWNLYPTLKRD